MKLRIICGLLFTLYITSAAYMASTFEVGDKIEKGFAFLNIFTWQFLLIGLWGGTRKTPSYSVNEMKSLTFLSFSLWLSDQLYKSYIYVDQNYFTEMLAPFLQEGILLLIICITIFKIGTKKEKRL